MNRAKVEIKMPDKILNSVTQSPIDTLRSMISPKLKAQQSGESSKPGILFGCLKQFFSLGGPQLPSFNSERRKNSEELFGWAQDEEKDDESKIPTTPVQVSVLDMEEEDLFCSKSDNGFLSPKG